MSYDPSQRSPYGQQPPYGQVYGQQSPPPVVMSGPPVSPYPPAQPYGTAPPGYQVPGQVPGYQVPAPAPAPKKRAKWPWIVGGIVLAMIAGCVGLFTVALGGTAKVAGDLDDNQRGKNAVAGQMNTPIKDGKFQFTVTKMTCGQQQVGDDVLNQQAQGEFCLVDVSVKNIGTSAEIFSDTSQTGADAAGNQYSVDSGAGVYANQKYSTFLEDINPGNSVKGRLVFDVPAGMKLSAVVLHESMFTTGVRIPLK